MGTATKDQMERDHAISRKKAPKKQSQSAGFGATITATKELIQEYAATSLVLLYIINGVLAAGILLDVVDAPDSLKQLVGSLAIAYSAVAFVMFINRGVKHQLAERKNKES